MKCKFLLILFLNAFSSFLFSAEHTVTLPQSSDHKDRWSNIVVAQDCVHIIYQNPRSEPYKVRFQKPFQGACEFILAPDSTHLFSFDTVDEGILKTWSFSKGEWKTSFPICLDKPTLILKKTSWKAMSEKLNQDNSILSRKILETLFDRHDSYQEEYAFIDLFERIVGYFFYIS